MDGHRVIDLVAADTEGGVENMAKARRFGTMIDTDMGQGGFSVYMTAQAEYWALIGVDNDHLHSGASGRQQADVAVGVMAGDAAISAISMGGQDVVPVQDRMAGGARF